MTRREMLYETPAELEERVRTLLGEVQPQKDGRMAPAQDGQSPELHTSALSRDPVLTLLLPLLILLSTLLFLLIFFLVFIVVLKKKRRQGIALQDDNGPLDLAREEELEGEGGLVGVEQRWLEQQEDTTKAGYDRGQSERDCWLISDLSVAVQLMHFQWK